MDISKINGKAWDHEAENGSAWARIISKEAIEKARDGNLELRVTIDKTIPRSWTEPLKGKRVLSLGGGGGQQTPLLAAFGCDVATVDCSSEMIERDRKALEEYSLDADLYVHDMSSMPFFPDSSFDAAVSPVSLNFVEDIECVYREVKRVLKNGGTYIFGIANPALYLFDDRLLAKGKMKIRYTLPFSDSKSLSRKELEKRIAKNDTVEFSHTLDTILGSLTGMGFAITGFFSDYSSFEPIDSFLQDCYLAIRAVCRKD
ncbi:MAG: class I SAM-dependent methyltransferase [Spirochaetes bacterium]|uniref:Class I SAM-dependent methyltransferase n=1 Tax=Candidatus Ornithospirochaeta stercoripullorum TaxID=2840899 RepID=A0A9D9H2K0_9SPIO|nr:class I SAM-dependent methyltransferase [Candidatus Ornithospirochaeta stercoripullorum]